MGTLDADQSPCLKDIIQKLTSLNSKLTGLHLSDFGNIASRLIELDGWEVAGSTLVAGKIEGYEDSYLARAAQVGHCIGYFGKKYLCYYSFGEQPETTPKLTEPLTLVTIWPSPNGPTPTDATSRPEMDSEALKAFNRLLTDVENTIKNQ